ncbi:MAG: DNA-binding protein [Lentimicrobiaceae bacterium]|nr:DNA-binding protein [Lentimicrobiaceae bacterium]
MSKKIKAFIEIGEKLDYDIWIDLEADVPFGLLGQGKTILEAKQDFLGCYEDMRNSYRKRKKEFPEIEFEFVYDIPSFLKYSPFPLTWLSDATGINKKQLSHYTTEHRNPSRATLVKIQDAVNKFVADYSQVCFV